MKGLRFILLLAFAITAPPTVFGAMNSYDSYGRVVIGNFSPKAGMAKVVFDHWLHRTQFTCRVCHVDIGFLMESGGTRIKAADNMKGYYCGACHNGKMQTYEGPVFKACTIPPKPDDMARCDRCHSFGKNVQKNTTFPNLLKKWLKPVLVTVLTGKRLKHLE